MRSLSFLLLLATLSAPLITGAQDDQSNADQKQESTARASEVSSSKDTRIDLNPPANDQKSHPNSGAAISDAENAATDVQELHPWDPHKAAKDLEVGDFYFKKKNYRAALDRYREALVYKHNDAIAQFRLAECFDKTGNSAEAVTHYQEYLRILPHGPFAAEAQKSLERLKANGAKASSAK